MTKDVLTKKYIYLVSDIEYAKEINAYVAKSKDGLDLFGLVGYDHIDELTPEQKEYVLSDEAIPFQDEKEFEK